MSCARGARTGADDRVRVLAADIAREPLSGSYGVAVPRAIVQALSAEEARAALRHVGRAVEPGGAIYVVDT